MAAIAIGEWQKGKWVENWDEYNDVPFWEHNETGETRWTEPLLEEWLRMLPLVH